MLADISLQDARATQWDVVIVGSSFAAIFFLYGLPAGLSVLVVEQGKVARHDELLFREPNPNEIVPVDNQAGREKGWVKSLVFGGNSNCWWGQTPRFHPSDFDVKSRFGIAEDWPVSYDDLQSSYGEVEQIMEIAGGGDTHILPRSGAYPYPPHTPSRSDAFLQQNDPLWVPGATARSNGGSRSTCCATGICHHCPIDAKFSILNAVDKFTRPGAFLLKETEAVRVVHDGGIATGLVVQSGGAEHVIMAQRVGLGANAIFNAAILLRSDFRSPAIGRYLHEQTSVEVEIDTPIQNFFGGTSITGLGYHFYHDFDRRDKAAVLMQNFNVPASIRPLKDRWTERLTVKLVAEDIPQPENRVVLDGRNPKIEWIGHHQYSYDGLAYAMDNLSAAFPTALEAVRIVHEPVTEAHIQGTTRMGDDPASSVIDRDLRLHEATNVWVLGAGAFPSCSPANPTLTLAALSLRASRALT